MMWWIIGAIVVYVAIGVVVWIVTIATDSWGSLFLYPLYAILLIVGWLPFVVINWFKEIQGVNEWYRETFKKRKEK